LTSRPVGGEEIERERKKEVNKERKRETET
jgi:hypothetical protein